MLIYINIHRHRESRESSVGIATGCRFDGRDSIPDRGMRYFFTPQRADRL
jgi:hypothetical protein